jgi:hypothetical protein
MTTAAHAYAHKARLEEAGLKRVTVWVPNDEKSIKRVQKYAQKVRRETGVKAPRD